MITDTEIRTLGFQVLFKH